MCPSVPQLGYIGGFRVVFGSFHGATHNICFCIHCVYFATNVCTFCTVWTLCGAAEVQGWRQRGGGLWRLPNVFIHLAMHFIDTYITELSAIHGLVCSWQDNSDMLKSLHFEL